MSALAPVPASAARPGGVTAPETADLVVRWQEHDDRRARDELFSRFHPLARKLAGRYAGPHEPLEDLVQVAGLGLLGAIDRFDPHRGTPFAAFAIPTILGELKRYFRNAGWSVHVPRGAQEMALRVDHASRALTGATGQTPSPGAIADWLNASVEDVLNGLEAGSAHYAASLDAPATASDDEEPRPLVDRLGNHDDRYGLLETRLSLSAASARLPHLERRALSMRVNHNMKQSEIAQQMGCSQMQVSRLLRRAAAELRRLTDPELEAAPVHAS